MPWNHGIKIKYHKFRERIMMARRKLDFQLNREIFPKISHFVQIKLESFELERVKLPLAVITLLMFCAVYFVIRETQKEITLGVQDYPVVHISNKIRLERKLVAMVNGYPIQEMVPYISEHNEKVAAFLVSIAKKESNWGRRVPVYNGENCYNYWGFRKVSDTMGSDGHTCFNSPQQAVDQVASRIEELVNEEKIDTPKEMVIWKCGYACDGPEAYGAQKWVSDVSYYFNKIVKQ
jgi:hypothetical protein